MRKPITTPAPSARSRIVNGYEPRFDIDLAYGRQGELQIDEFLKWIANGDARVETKTKRYIDLELYIEQEQDPEARGRYKPSGITTTEALVWCFCVDDTGIHVAIPTEILREAVTWPSSKPVESYADADNPSRGMLVNFGMVLFRVKQKREAARRALESGNGAPK